MLNLIPALRVKDTTIFDLLDQAFYYEEFVCFYRLAVHLGNIAKVPLRDAEDVGHLSELIYLSSKIHFGLTEQVETEAQLRAQQQMPVLIGDLLYGRFIVALTETEKTDCLPVYLDYLKQFNRQRVDWLQSAEQNEGEQNSMGRAESYIQLLAQKTAVVIGTMAEADAELQHNLEIAAENFMEERWPFLQREPISTLHDLEEKIQAELI